MIITEQGTCTLLPRVARAEKRNNHKLGNSSRCTTPYLWRGLGGYKDAPRSEFYPKYSWENERKISSKYSSSLPLYIYSLVLFQVERSSLPRDLRLPFTDPLGGSRYSLPLQVHIFDEGILYFILHVCHTLSWNARLTIAFNLMNRVQITLMVCPIKLFLRCVGRQKLPRLKSL